ncbi:hypothetical protein [Kitasatospora sp. MAP5-34]|uniref:hypothetical protein n=1 Tax=Kitasatospora sp. MAP5-34 TaxID=3035102 RepID=UPI0024747449|nr:hypothetical protein [Kitasatospora sp. MAP5-34]MDH6575803.1 hypothetical protein [Kitasatospora sp. MAP5-34]
MPDGLTLAAAPTEGWLRVPVGREASRWATRGRCRRVLLVVHNVTSATRLLDVLPLLTGDFRVQVVVSSTGSSPFAGGIPELFGALGLPVLPWAQARAEHFDLAVSASYGGELALLEAPLVVLSHGAGYNKRLATPDTGHRTPDTGHRTPDTGHRTPWRQWQRCCAGGGSGLRAVGGVAAARRPADRRCHRALPPRAARPPARRLPAGRRDGRPGG